MLRCLRPGVALLLLLLLALLGAKTTGGGTGEAPDESSISLLPSCNADNEGTRRVAKNSTTALAPLAGGSNRVSVLCSRNRWIAEIGYAEAVMAPLHNAWRVRAGGPLIDKFNLPSGLSESVCAVVCIPNDPTVLTGTDCPAGSGLCMWYGLGVLGGGVGVDIYYATSTDGLAWTDGNSGSPVLTDGGGGTWNDCGSETPSVRKIGSTWWMAITAYKDPTCADATRYTMGIATSADGITWSTPTELTELTSVVAAVGATCVNGVWGSQTRAEPGLGYVAGDARPYKLVFADVRCNNGVVERGISLADSVTGAAGTWAQVGSTPILLPDAPYDTATRWQGFSAPDFIVDGGTVILAASVFRQDAEGVKQRGIATFTGASLTTLALANPMAVPSTPGTWLGDVRAPALVKAACGTSSAVRCLYFAGDDSVGQGLASTTINGADANGNLVFRAREFGSAGARIRIVLAAASGAGSVATLVRPGGYTITTTPAAAGNTATAVAAQVNADAEAYELVRVTAGGTGASAPGTSAGVNLSGAVGPPLSIGIGLAVSL